MIIKIEIPVYTVCITIVCLVIGYFYGKMTSTSSSSSSSSSPSSASIQASSSDDNGNTKNTVKSSTSFNDLIVKTNNHDSNNNSVNIISSTSNSTPLTPITVRTRKAYRMEEEQTRHSSSEYTRRGQLWSRHASWHLPMAPRDPRLIKLVNRGFDFESQGIEHVTAILRKYDVDPVRGFLPKQDPLQRLPYARYHLWEDLGDDLPKLLGARLGQARDPLQQLPVLETDKLVTDAELRRAHLLLCLFAHAYIWGGITPLDEIPIGIAKPLYEVSQRLGIPPVLGHPSIVLYNWRRLDEEGAISMENLSTLNNFFDGRDESWFYLITVEIEAKGAAAIVPIMLAFDAIQRYREEVREKNEFIKRLTDGSSSPKVRSDSLDFKAEIDELKIRHFLSCDEEDESPYDKALIGELTISRVTIYVTEQLKRVAESIKDICTSLSNMREGCHPFIFYHRVRPFLSGWRDNPTLIDGVIYKGVMNDTRQKYYGGSAAQSSLLPFLDIALGISHDSIKSKDFLLAMRDYMIKSHKEFLEYIETIACIRPFVLENIGDNARLPKSLKDELRSAYDNCVSNLQSFRTGHISLVAEYILAQQKRGDGQKLEGSAGGKGTGGTDLMNFLKPIRDVCGNSLIVPASKKENDESSDKLETKLATETVKETANDEDNSPYLKDNGAFEDIDLFRGATFTKKMPYQLPDYTGWNNFVVSDRETTNKM